MPIIQLELAIRISEQLIPVPIKMGNKNWVEIPANEELILEVKMTRIGRGNRNLRAYTPRMARGADETWFLSLGSVENVELVALKRVAGLRNSSTHQITFTLNKPGTQSKNVNTQVFFLQNLNFHY